MNTNAVDVKNNALVLIHSRNFFYRDKYYLLLGLFLLTLIANGILIGIIVYLVKNPTRPYYFPSDSVGRLTQDVPLNQPNMSLQAVSDWVVHAVEAINSYNFINYRSQLQDDAKYFTNYGWSEFNKGLKSSNNLLAVTERKFIMLGKVVEPPKLLVEGNIDGVHSYKFQMPVLITSLLPPTYDDKTKMINPWIVTVIVQRESPLIGYQGLGISQYIGSLASS